MKTLLRFAAALGLLPCAATAVLITNNVYVGPLDTTYDGQDIIVSNATLTVDGPHAIAGLRVEPGGVVTHSAVPSGLITLTNRFPDEPQLLVSTNDVTLANSNTVATVVSVTDASATVIYTNNTDYIVTLMGGQGFVRRTDASAIPDGALVLITYDVTAGTVPSGLTLTVTNALTVTAGGAINVSGCGYSGTFGSGHGTIASFPLGGGGGGGHGGIGGVGGVVSSNSSGGVSFGAYDQPATLGGAGGFFSSASGAGGGGMVRLTCLSTLRLDGVMSASGSNATNNRTGGGAGGSVWITATNFTGAGSITANGGAGELPYGGGGAGGRIALEWVTNTFSGSVAARGGAGQQAGGAGTIFVRKLGRLAVVTVDNGGSLGGAGTPLSVTVNPDVIVQGGATLMNSGSQTVGNLIVRSNSTVLPTVTNTASMTFNIVSNLVVEATAKVSVRGCGSFPGSGSGVGQVNSFVGAGAGHGGSGGNGFIGASTNALGGGSYGTPSAPQTQGSGGRTVSSYGGGMGGGVIRLVVSRNTQLDGEINADALAGLADRAGGGSGGSIWITTGGFSGAGKISANGGAGGLPYGGGGGGGRIAVLFTSNDFTGALTARGGAGAMAGGAGSIYARTNSGSTADLLFDNGGLSGARTALAEGTSFKRVVITGGTILSVSNFSVNTFNSLLVGSNSSLLSGSSSQSFSVTSNAVIEAGGLISADGLSVNNNFNGSGGGGHGGAGGRGATTSFSSTGIMDNAVSPNTAGNAGGYGISPGTGIGRGGGVFQMTVTGALQLDGKITANGTDALTNAAGGGAGGSISLTVGGFSGAGQLVADGGSGFLPSGGGGGGGRIAVTCNAQTNTFTGSFSAKGGNGYQRGGAGTVYFNPGRFKNIPDIFVDNGGLPGTNTVISTSLINSYNLEIKGAGLVSSISGVSPANVLVRSNSWLAATGNLLATGDVTLEAGGGINLNGMGTTTTGNGSSVNAKGGAGHGGYGGANLSGGGNVYGSMTAPSLSGSTGGGSGSSFAPFGGVGGGALHLTVLGTMRVDGRVSSDGLSGDPGAGGGSGGSVWLTLNQFTGNGAISAAGGAGIPALGLGGGGGGGRIAITWNSNSFTGPITAPGGGGTVIGGAGTVYLKANNQPAGMLIVNNAGLFGTNTPLSSTYGLPTGWFDLTVGNAARAFFGSTPNLLSNLTVAANGRLISPSSSTLSLTTYGDLSVNSGGSITLDGRGSGRGVGPGAGASLSSKGAGGGHGGVGGAAASGAAGGAAFEFSSQPIGLGGGGGAGANVYSSGCEGGGAIKFTVAGTATIDGNLSANGNPGLQDDSGGGAGGSIWVMTKSLAGSGVIAADGGDGELYGGGGGGGGRIALYAKDTNNFTGLVSVLGGDGANAGQEGSIVFTTNMRPFIISTSVVGGMNGVASSADFVCNQVVDPATVSDSAFALAMPTNYFGPSPTSTAFVNAGSSSVTLAFNPPLSVPGDYSVIVQPTFADIFGTFLTQPYTNFFTVTVPTVEGHVRDTNGLGVSGVTVQTSGYLPATTDTNGFYALGVPQNWSGSITPSFGAKMFAPGSIALANVTAQTTNQDFLMVDTILPVVTSGASLTNITLDWSGMPGVTYYIEASTNIVDWIPWLGPLTATNAPIHVDLPPGTEPQGFFRLRAAN